MCAEKLLQNLLPKSCAFIHKKRLTALIEITNALVHTEKLNMTSLGNALSVHSQVCERHSIKRVSNFLSNPHIQEENALIQEALTTMALSYFTQVRIIVDWTPATNRCHYVLRANLIYMNSSIILYQETYPEKKVNNTKIQNAFLTKLKQLMPKQVKDVLIITDAGFQGEWFEKVETLGWYFCGRVRGKTQVKLPGSDAWEQVTPYAKKATAHVKSLGRGLLSKSHEKEMFMYTYKQPLKPLKSKSNRNNPNACTELKRSIRSYTEGWFIVTNLPQLKKKHKKIVINHYKDRMKIEASNRTTKSTKFGFGLSDSMTKKIERIKILLLIEQIASFAAWLVGAYEEFTGESRKYSNGGVKKGRRLSLIKIGIRKLKQEVSVPLKKIRGMLETLASLEPELC